MDGSERKSERGFLLQSLDLLCILTAGITRARSGLAPPRAPATGPSEFSPETHHTPSSIQQPHSRKDIWTHWLQIRADGSTALELDVVVADRNAAVQVFRVSNIGVYEHASFRRRLLIPVSKDRCFRIGSFSAALPLKVTREDCLLPPLRSSTRWNRSNPARQGRSYSYRSSTYAEPADIGHRQVRNGMRCLD